MKYIIYAVSTELLTVLFLRDMKLSTKFRAAIDIKIESECHCEKLIATYKTIRCHNPETYNMNLHGRENFKFHERVEVFTAMTMQ
jgi:hypothetical protein